MNEKIKSSTAQQGFARGNRRGMGAPVEKPKEGRKTLARLAAYFRPEMKFVILLALVVIIGVAASVTAPSLQSSAIDGLVKGSFGEIPRILGIMLFVYLIHGAATLLQGFLSARLSQRVIFRMRGELFGKVISLPIPYRESRARNRCGRVPRNFHWAKVRAR